MVERKATVSRASDRPEFRALLDRISSITLTEADLREQRVGFVYGDAPKDSQITKESVDLIRIGKGAGQKAGLARASGERPASCTSRRNGPSGGAAPE